jgi:serine/threonine-protein kinase
MGLELGARLGPYTITAAIGAGGMGEVYRATDTNLKRAVAIKVLPKSFATDGDRLARFQREAELLASLNHPNIAAIYGLERSNGTTALVMELVEGPTLADRIAQGAIPVDEALPIARQIADALEAAHEQGVVHRDLKPANIKVRLDGTVKVLDFGLAKALAPASAGSAHVSQSPTITSPALMTGVGMLLGTAAYMSPEQARAKPVDKRADIWAFGCVLYEMLAGRRAFDGEDVAAVLARVIEREPDWSALPASLPPRVQELLRLCLEKSSKRRRQAAGDVRIDLEQALIEPAAAPAIAGRVPSAERARRAWLLTAAVSALAALVSGAGVWLFMRPTPPAIIRTTLTASGAGELLPNTTDRNIAVTPDGSRIIYRGRDQLLVRAVDQLEPMALTGLGTPRGPFVAPDGQWIGFFDGNNTLKKVSITGRGAVTVTNVDGAGPRGASWGSDGTIIYATIAPATGLQRVSAAGGEPSILTKPDHGRGEFDHYWPEFLPGGEAVLYTIMAADFDHRNSQIAVLDLRTGQSKVLMRGGTHAQYVATGHLIYAAAGTVYAAAFDVQRLALTGPPVPVLERVLTSSGGSADLAVTTSGSLVYVAGASTQQTVVSVDREGRATPLPGIPVASYRDVVVSPDGSRIALTTPFGGPDVWTYDVARATASRLTTDPATHLRPVWARDGRRIVYSSDRSGYPELYWRDADGAGAEELFLSRGKDLIALLGSGWSPDGRQFLFSEVTAVAQCAIGQLPADRKSDVRIVMKNEFCNFEANVSPDGQWMAYESNMSGQREIYVEQYPELGNRQQISAGGGSYPTWSRDGRELFFRTPDGRHMFGVSIRSGPTFVANRPELLFELAQPVAVAPGARPYDITPDGRFIVITNAEVKGVQSSDPSLTLVLNWQEELKQRVPTR